jgi:hypothetical protein
MADLIFKAGFLDDGDAATGLTVTVNVYRITLSNAAVSQVVTAGSATEIGDGMYLYRYASADLSLYNYVAAFNTAGTADQSVVWCEGLVVPDELISSRSTVTTAQVNEQVDAALADYDAPTKAEMDSGFSAVPAAVAAEFASVGVVPINEDGATLDDLLEAIGDDIVEGTYTRNDISRLIVAALVGLTNGSGTDTITFTGLDGTTTRITATVSNEGNRTQMVLDGEA